MLAASTPGAPSLARTFSHASATRRSGISNDLTFSFGPPVGSSPGGWPPGDLTCPAPLAPAPLQGLHRYYGPVRPCASRYAASRGVRHLRVFLSHPGGVVGPFRPDDGSEATG